jgi:hypothetical protein
MFQILESVEYKFFSVQFGRAFVRPVGMGIAGVWVGRAGETVEIRVT